MGSFPLSSGFSALCFPFLLLLVSRPCAADLPTELNAFMDKLFENEECEEFVGSDFTSIATSECEPFTCDFPRQLCQRPSAQYRDKAANMCRDIPEKCVTAANGGVPLGPPRTRPTAVRPGGKARKIMPGMIGGTGEVQNKFSGFTLRPVNPLEICQMDPPTGRFCGFKNMFTYNKETLQCDEFWFPGCPTAETNANLFKDYQDCQKVAELCKPTPAPFRPLIPAPLPTIAPPPPPPPPPPPAPSPLPGGLGNFFGSGTGGAPQPAGGGGDGEDMGLFGLIQKGFSTAQAVKAGGPQGKEAASQAAGQILQTFTGFDINNIGSNFGNFFGR